MDTAAYSLYSSCWGLSHIEPLANTVMGCLFKATTSSGTAVLKVTSEAGRGDHGGAIHALNWWNGDGAVRVLQHDQDALLMEWLDGERLADLVENGRDDEATEQLGKLLLQLHGRRDYAHPTGLVQLGDFLRGSGFKGLARDIAEWLLTTQAEQVLLHGDLHHANVLRCRERDAWLAIDPKGLLGERAFDAAAFLLSPMHETTRNAEVLSRRSLRICEVADLDIMRVLGYAYLEAVGISEWAERMGFSHLHEHMSEMATLIEASLKQSTFTPAVRVQRES